MKLFGTIRIKALIRITVAIFHGPRWLFLPMGMFLVALTTGWEVLIMRVVILLGMERGLASFANELKMKKYFLVVLVVVSLNTLDQKNKD